ncbi:hypothetical protein LINPERPRIM_LOCUS29644 [Linum perenne]
MTDFNDYDSYTNEPFDTNSDELFDTDSDDEAARNLLLLFLLKKKKQRLPCRTSTRQGHDWVQELLHGHKTRIYESLRMDKKMFKYFCKELKEHGGLSSSKNVIVEEQVAIFLRVLTHSNTARDGAELFQHSTATISKYFRRVLKAVIGLSKRVIVPPNFREVP